MSGIADLLIAAVDAGGIRNDVPPDELANYCLHAVAAASSLDSEAGVHRLVRLTLAALRGPQDTASAVHRARHV
jgi:hypothetical protein